MGKFVKFQESVGRASSSIGLVMTYIFASIFGLIGLVLAVFSFIPRTETRYRRDGTVYKVKVHDYFLLIPAVLLISGAVFSILISSWWNNMTHHNKDAAFVAGTAEEVGIVQNILGNN